jgi:hypothetical protein
LGLSNLGFAVGFWNNRVLPPTLRGCPVQISQIRIGIFVKIGRMLNDKIAMRSPPMKWGSCFGEQKKPLGAAILFKKKSSFRCVLPMNWGLFVGNRYRRSAMHFFSKKGTLGVPYEMGIDVFCCQKSKF